MLLTLDHPAPLIPGRLIDRYDRFVAEVELARSRRVRAHCVNPGRMEGMVAPGTRVWLSAAPPERKRKLPYTWELSEDHDEPGLLVGANTSAPNRIIRALLEARVLAGLRRFRSLRSEVGYGERSRVDFLLEGATPHFIEVKNCHLVYPDRRGYFPDSVSVRASEHLERLADEVRGGAKATVLFTIQHPHARALRPSQLHDPSFAEAARAAARAGVRFRALVVAASLDAYMVLREVPVDLREVSAGELEVQRRWRDERLPRSGWRPDPARG